MTASSSAPSSSDARAGFTLLEALVALAIAAAILSSVASVAAQALRNWNRGHGTIAGMEMLTTGLGRLGTDLSLALPVRPPGSDERNLLFKGDESSMMFVAATGFGAGNRGLELLTLAVTPDSEGIALTRKRGPVQTLATQQTDPVVLLRGRMKVRFGYRGVDGKLETAWANRPELPAAVEVEVLGASGTPIFPVATVLPLPSRLSVECLGGAAGATGAGSTPVGKSGVAAQNGLGVQATDGEQQEGEAETAAAETDVCGERDGRRSGDGAGGGEQGKSAGGKGGREGKPSSRPGGGLSSGGGGRGGSRGG